MDIDEAIGALTRRVDLTREQAGMVQRLLMTGHATHAQTAALLTALHKKGETIDEIAGFAETMRALATPIRTKRSPLVDTCGTGGDQAGTFNISTAAAFVAAGAGVAVAKHGNRSATSRCGSADVLEALGVNVDASPETVGHCIDAVGIGFLYARALHGAMRHVAPVRAELGFRTIFNLLGPLTNPAGADRQVMGVFRRDLVEPIAHVLLRLGTHHAFVVAGHDGLDEITLTAHSTVAEVKDGRVTAHKFLPEQHGFSHCRPEELHGGDAHQNAEILKTVLQGGSGPKRDITLLNAAPALVAAGRAQTLGEGIALAVEAIDTGAAYAKLQQLIEASHDLG